MSDKYLCATCKYDESCTSLEPCRHFNKEKYYPKEEKYYSKIEFEKWTPSKIYNPYEDIKKPWNISDNPIPEPKNPWNTPEKQSTDIIKELKEWEEKLNKKQTVKKKKKKRKKALDLSDPKVIEFLKKNGFIKIPVPENPEVDKNLPPSIKRRIYWERKQKEEQTKES